MIGVPEEEKTKEKKVKRASGRSMVKQNMQGGGGQRMVKVNGG
jgi:hypothetical protein